MRENSLIKSASLIFMGITRITAVQAATLERYSTASKSQGDSIAWPIKPDTGRKRPQVTLLTAARAIRGPYRDTSLLSRSTNLQNIPGPALSSHLTDDTSGPTSF